MLIENNGCISSKIQNQNFLLKCKQIKWTGNSVSASGSVPGHGRLVDRPTILREIQREGKAVREAWRKWRICKSNLP